MMDKHQTKKLRSRVRAVWRRRQLLNVTAGMLAFCRWAVLLFLAGMAIDWLTRLPMPARVVARKTVRAMRRGKHEIILSAGGNLLVWLDRFCPPLADRLIARFG